MALDFAAEGFEQASTRQQVARRKFALKALRMEVLRMLLRNPSFRPFSRMVASSDLLADFCGVRPEVRGQTSKGGGRSEVSPLIAIIGGPTANRALGGPALG